MDWLALIQLSESASPLLSASHIIEPLTAMATSLRYVIIGAGALPVACAELLVERGHVIVALVSSDRLTLEWARSRGIVHGRSMSALAALIEGQAFDYLLSVVNFQKLPGAILQAPSRLAINYHDAPLPRYAGSHAVTWALLNDEARHAVTWHVMTDRVDAGDILKQVEVEIDQDDTALTLNLKCHEAALNGFRALLDDMEVDAVDPRRQELAQRTFFPRNQQPAPGCVLPFQMPADYLLAMLRALDFGPHPNPLGLPKIATGESFALATQLDLLDGQSTVAAGTIVRIVEDGLEVATATQNVVVGGFLTLEGEPLSTSEVVERGGLRIGANLLPDAGRSARLAALCERLARYEPFWTAQLAKAKPLTLPCSSGTDSHTPQTPGWIDVPISGSNRAFVASLGLRAADGLLTVFMALLARLTGREVLDIGFDDACLRAEVGDLHAFFATCLPLRVAARGECSFARFTQVMREQLARVRARHTYARDLLMRDPALRTRPEGLVPFAWPVVVEILEPVDQVLSVSLPEGRLLTVQIGAGGDACRLLYDPDVLAPTLVEQLSCQFAWLLQALPACAEVPLQELPLLDAVAGSQSGESRGVSAF